MIWGLIVCCLIVWGVRDRISDLLLMICGLDVWGLGFVVWMFGVWMFVLFGIGLMIYY